MFLLSAIARAKKFTSEYLCILIIWVGKNFKDFFPFKSIYFHLKKKINLEKTSNKKPFYFKAIKNIFINIHIV